MDLWFEANQVPPAAKISQAAILLDNYALTWWMMLTRENRQPRNWPLFKVAISNQFQSFNGSLNARE
jgi:hypothetical protein